MEVRNGWLNMLFIWVLLLCLNGHISQISAVKCVSCVGRGCMRNVCDSDVCVSTYYAANWNEGGWFRARVVKGCMSGTMLNPYFQDHCETTKDGNGIPVQTCYCKSELCNGRLSSRLPEEPMKFVECNCEGRQCREPICLGRFCTYVVNHLTMQTERGCSNLSIPLLDKRVGGACMSPPVSGALHTNVARTGDDLLHTESCFCQTNYCNSGAPLVGAAKEMRCPEKVQGSFYGHTLTSTRKRDCPGEFCFQTDVKSDLGEPSEFSISGCISFMNGSQLAEELNPTGCGYFASDGLVIRSCFTSKDQTAIDRAQNSQIRREVVSTASTYNIEYAILAILFICLRF